MSAIAITILKLWNGDSWLTELKRGTFPAVMIAVFSEVSIRDAKRRRSAQ
jgi:hypothetical protein